MAGLSEYMDANASPAQPVAERGDIDVLRESVATYCTPHELDGIERVYTYARDAHAGKLRYSGNPYIVHPVGVAERLAALRMPAIMVMAGLLHDVVEDAGKPLEEIRQTFGKEIADLVEGVTKIGKIRLQGEARYIENLRKMFVAMAKDIRVIIIKFADRLHNLATLAYVPEPKRTRIARESIEIHAPIANRLGMGEIKGQLEDLAFPYAYPAEAAWIASLVASTEETRRVLCEDMRAAIAHALDEHHIPFIAIDGRMKHRYSLYQKLLRNDRDITKIHDLIALRIIVSDVPMCYAALGIIHQEWKPLKGRIKDYIANPKPNGYRSLHTTVFSEGGEPVEFQVRTQEMHEEAEWGAAAAWRYHERGVRRVSSRQLRWVNDLVRWQRSVKDPKEFLEGLKLEVLRDRILICTPKGDVIDLPDGATPLDFAYAIHSNIGDHATGARVNGAAALWPLDRPLQNGDMVEIITDAKRQGPSPDWLTIVRTSRAREKIREALRGGLRKKVSGWMNGRTKTERKR